KAPALVQAEVAVEKARNILNRQRTLHQRGAGTVEELQNAETDFKAAEAAHDNAFTTARNVIAMAAASKVAIHPAEQTLADLVIRAPSPSKLPEGHSEKALRYGVSRRSVSEGQVLKDGDQVFELVVEDPLRLWTNVPERYSAEVKLGQPVRVAV